MRKLFLSVCLLVSMLAVAQKVSIKKDKILYDKEPIGILLENKKEVTVLDLERTPLFKVESAVLMLNIKKYLQYFKVSTLDGSKEVCIEVPYRGSGQVRSKQIVKELSSTAYPVFTERGIDKEAVNKIMNTDDKKLSSLIQKIREAEKSAKENVKAFDKMGVSINNDGEFGTSERGEFTLLGKIERREEEDKDKRLVYELLDEYGKQVVIWNEEGDNNLVFPDGKSVYVPASLASPFFSANTDDLVKLMIYVTYKSK